MAFTQAHLDAFDAAIAQQLVDGLPQVVMYDGKRVEYRSIDDTIKARSLIARLVSQSTTQSRTTLASFSKG